MIRSTVKSTKDSSTQNLKDETVTIVGAGITSIMTALHLSDLGYQITIYSKGPDPRFDRDAEQYGATGNGRSARFITGLEGKPHLFEGSIIPDETNELYAHFTDGGWLTMPVTEYSQDDQDWLKKRHKAASDPQHSANLYSTYYAKFSHDSLIDWIDLLKSKPFLFENTDTTSHEDGVLVVCNSDNLLKETIDQYAKYNFLKRILTKSEINQIAPIYKNACDNGNIAGGLIVDGFAFNIHQFIENSLNHLEQKNVTFMWNEEVLEIEVGDDGRVQGLRTTHHNRVTSHHYSVNAGAYANQLLNNTPAQGKVAGVAGRWLIIPRPDGFTLPTKILTDSRFGPSIGDNNLTPFTDNSERMLAISGGSVFVGSDHRNLPSANLCQMMDIENERILRLYLPTHYNELKKSDTIKAWTNTCLRSFTYDDQPVHDTMKTKMGGVLTITAGTNTGTTALAPHLANWTSQTLIKKDTR